MIFSVIAVVSIIFYMIVGGVGASSLPIVGASSLIGELVAILMSCLSFGCALYAFIDIQRAETWGLRCGRKCRKQNHYSLIFSGRVYYIFKIISLAVSILVFIFISHNFSDVGSLIFSSLISAYVIWCIWSLHEALMLGGKAAEDVGFSKDQVTSPSIPSTHVASHPPTLLILPRRRPGKTPPCTTTRTASSADSATVSCTRLGSAGLGGRLGQRTRRLAT